MVLTTCAVQEFGGEDAGSDDPESTAGPTNEPDPTEDDPTEDEPAEPACELAADLDPAEARAAADGGSLEVAAAVAAAVDCVDQVVLVPADDHALAAVAAPLAASTGAPLLLGDVEELDATLAALDGPEVRELDRGTAEAPRTAAEVSLDLADELGLDRFVAVAEDQPNLLTAAAEVAIRTDAAVLPVDPAGPAPEVPTGAEVVTTGDLSELLPDAAPAEAAWTGPDPDAPVAWVFDPADPAAVPAVTIAALRGDTVAAISGGDLLARRNVTRVRDAGLTDASLLAVGSFAGDPSVQLAQLTEAPLLPGGTLRLFDGTRMVALYGTPGTSSLGVLGEQDLDGAIARVQEVSEGYDADGRDIVPTFEIIVTVASNSAEGFSNVAPPERFQEWVDRAGEEGIQVILDLQPGRTDFLTQARIYEDLLREPHVGLALDPEWRLEDDQRHLEQIGGVEAAEVQTVVDWLAEITREEGQTQKLLVLHQFRMSMLRDRDTIEIPPEIAAVVHADGQGPQPMKLETWRTMTQGAEDRWLWGWKNFYDEDPVVAEPSYVLDLEPEVVLVTYQ